MGGVVGSIHARIGLGVGVGCGVAVAGTAVGVVAVGDAARDGVGLALTEGVMVLGTTVAVGDAQAVSRTKTMITINVFLDMLTFP